MHKKRTNIQFNQEPSISEILLDKALNFNKVLLPDVTMEIMIVIRTNKT